MNRVAIKSDNIKSAGYDEKAQVLEIEFHKGKQLYRYFGVPSQAYDGLINSTSPGKFFQVMIRGKYSYTTKDIEP